MVNYITLCTPATGSRTWVLAFFSNTSFITRAFRMHNAFWSTVWRWSNVLSQAGAWWSTSVVLTYSICSTWWWYAWVYINRFVLWWWWRRYSMTMWKWISSISRSARTHRTMVEHPAVSILCTPIFTWVFTFLINTSETCWTFCIQYTFWATSGRTSYIVW